MAAKLKKGDRVVVLTGKDKGKKGEITEVMPKDNKAVVEGVNIAIRHTRQSQTRAVACPRRCRSTCRTSR
jgi:large subunit ribosomal protein L24